MVDYDDRREYYTYHVGLVLNNEEGIYRLVQEWIDENLSTEDKEEASEMMAKWLKEWVGEAIYDQLDIMGDDIGAKLIKEVLDFGMVDWTKLAEEYLEDYEPETDEEESEADEEESEADEIENDQSENCTVFRGENVGPMRSDY